jgi:hypothetical protein
MWMNQYESYYSQITLQISPYDPMNFPAPGGSPGIPFYTGSGFDTIAELGGLATSSAPRQRPRNMQVLMGNSIYD